MCENGDIRAKPNGELWYPVPVPIDDQIDEIFEQLLRNNAFHEAGHAVFAYLAKYRIDRIGAHPEGAQTVVEDFADLHTATGASARLKHVIAGPEAGNKYAPLNLSERELSWGHRPDPAFPIAHGVSCDNQKIGEDLRTLSGLACKSTEALFIELRAEVLREMESERIMAAIADLADALFEFGAYGHGGFPGWIAERIIENAFNAVDQGTPESENARRSFLCKVKEKARIPSNEPTRRIREQPRSSNSASEDGDAV